MSEPLRLCVGGPLDGRWEPITTVNWYVRERTGSGLYVSSEASPDFAPEYKETKYHGHYIGGLVVMAPDYMASQEIVKQLDEGYRKP